ncbi:replication factor A protein 1-like [Carex rostrata]
MHRQRIMRRITKLWTSQNPTYGKIFSHDFILVDKEKTAIKGFIDVDDPDANDVLQKIEEGSVYEIYKFRLDGSRDQYKRVDHKFRIQLTASTEITKVIDGNATFPLRYFDFKSLKSIGTTIKGAKTIVDVIGQVTSIGPIKQVLKNHAQVSIRDIEIEDERDDKVLINIWEDYLPQIDFQKI